MITATKLETLQPFCDRNTDYIKTPWWADGLAWSTDGRIFCVVPHEQFESPAVGRKRPNLSQYIVEPPDLVWQPLPVIPSCAECSNAGIVPEQECDECSGTGEVDHECDCEHCAIEEEDCEECGGTGRLKDYRCDDCFHADFGVLIDGCKFARGYLRKIAALGEVQVAVVGGNKHGELYFRSGEFFGLLMGLAQ